MAAPFLLIDIGPTGKRIAKNCLNWIETNERYLLPLLRITPANEEKNLKELLKEFLSPDNLRKVKGVSPKNLEIRVIGDLNEPRVQESVLAITDSAHRLAQKTFPGIKIRCEVLLIVPYEEWDKSITDFVQLYTEAHKHNTSPIDFLWLASSFNGQMLLKRNELEESCLQFLLLQIIHGLSNRIWQNELPSESHTGIGSFGVSGVIFPAEDVIKEKCAKFGTTFLEDEILPHVTPINTGSEINDLLEGVKSERLDERLARENSENVKNKIKVGRFLFRKVDKRFWADRLASFYSFFLRERLKHPIKIIHENAQREWDRVYSDIHRIVDRLIKKSRNPSGLLPFLDSLSDKVASLIERIIDKGKDKSEEFKNSIKGMKDAYQNLPGLWPVILKPALGFILFSYIAFYLTPKIFAGPSLAIWKLNLPLWGFVSIFALFCLHATFAILLYRNGRKEFNNAVSESIRIMNSDLILRIENEIKEQAIGIQEKLRHATASRETREKESEYSGISIWDKVDKYVTVLEDAVPVLQARKFPKLTAPYRDIEDILETQPSFNYKKGAYTLSQEVDDIINKGFHKDWEEMSPDKIAERIEELVTPGFEYIRNITAEYLLLNHFNQDKLRNFYQTLLNDSVPLLALDLTLQDKAVSMNYICVENENTSTIAERLRVNPSQRISTGDSYGIYVLQTLLHINPSQIVSLSKEKGG
ncbi:hypothetical protein KAW65_07630 [candidate division WOR-3 bacterium]|nr:hypothetical protein [candidate division WOR-3 bacterium]